MAYFHGEGTELCVALEDNEQSRLNEEWRDERREFIANASKEGLDGVKNDRIGKSRWIKVVKVAVSKVKKKNMFL